MQKLAAEGVGELMVEAGSGLNGALLQQGLVDEIVLYLAPCLIGNSAKGLFDLPELSSLSNKTTLSLGDIRQVGRDVRLTLSL
jgi:diaminohydroxyphosphoribosylaminopyrimidine deaminase/5-amino-6-(5-phosphoribosylamino)uracil reductase